MTEQHKIGSKRTRETVLQWDEVTQQLSIAQGESVHWLSKDHVDRFFEIWAAKIRPCSYGNQPHPLKGLHHTKVECDTQKWWYRTNYWIVGTGCDPDMAVRIIIGAYEFMTTLTGLAAADEYGNNLPQLLDDAAVGRMVRTQRPDVYAKWLNAANAPVPTNTDYAMGIFLGAKIL